MTGKAAEDMVVVEKRKGGEGVGMAAKAGVGVGARTRSPIMRVTRPVPRNHKPAFSSVPACPFRSSFPSPPSCTMKSVFYHPSYVSTSARLSTQNLLGVSPSQLPPHYSASLTRGTWPPAPCGHRRIGFAGRSSARYFRSLSDRAEHDAAMGGGGVPNQHRPVVIWIRNRPKEFPHR